MSCGYKPLKGPMLDCIHNVTFLQFSTLKNKRIPSKPQAPHYRLPNQIQSLNSFFGFKRDSKRIKGLEDITRNHRYQTEPRVDFEPRLHATLHLVNR
ncbi:unnamed protein product [Trifolium pratense]|uniref:Uncharacterized protein n=1 Tax=Trifolium pratense TaxID=57577 RepID=A0ACB0JU39_TRIPR|nr:unnamed protein product [Trifolium pratense]